jgi:DNA-binding transcriptional LysR family regulator
VLDISLDDRFVDLVEEGFDMAIRITRMEDSSLIARRLCRFLDPLLRQPAFLPRTARRSVPQDLARDALHHRHQRTVAVQLAVPEGKRRDVQRPVSGPIEVNSPRHAAAAIAGLGIAPLPDFIAAETLREAGRLVPCSTICPARRHFCRLSAPSLPAGQGEGPGRLPG